MDSIEITYLEDSPMALIKFKNGNSTQECYLPKVLVDMIKPNINTETLSDDTRIDDTTKVDSQGVKAVSVTP